MTDHVAGLRRIHDRIVAAIRAGDKHAERKARRCYRRALARVAAFNRTSGDTMPRDHIGPVLTVFGHTFDIVGGRTVRRVKLVDTSRAGDYGADPILDDNGNPTGLVKLIPSGRVVTVEEKTAILSRS